MSRTLSAAALVVAAGATAGVIFASVQISKTTGQLDRIEARLAGLEKNVGITPSPEPKRDGTATEGGGDAPGAPGKVETLAETIREVKRMREELATLQEGPGSSPHVDSPAVTPGAPPISPEEAVMRKVVEDVLAAKDKERAEADKKRAAEWQKARLERTVADLTERLGLSALQKDQMAQILGVASEKQSEIWAATKEGENPWPKVQEVRKDADGQVKQYLTAEQQGKYDEYMKASYGPPRFSGGGATIQPAPGGR